MTLNDNGAVIRKAIEWRGAPMALATVISTWGAAPRPRGSHMLVHRDGRLEGSISGGCVETDVLQRAAEVIAGRPAHVHSYGVADGDDVFQLVCDVALFNNLAVIVIVVGLLVVFIIHDRFV